jgi:acyl dehydratase
VGEEERSWPIGKSYDGGRHALAAKAFRAYADATDDPTAAYGPVAPPMFHVRPFIGMMLGMAGDDELDIDMLRLVHGEHDVSFRRPLADGETLHVTGELLSVDVKASGRVYAFALYGDVDGERVVEGRTAYFVRGPNPPAKTGPKAPPPELPEPSWMASQPVSADQASRYADASGDRNPIHLDESVARKAGLPGVILHGLCTMAFAARDLLAHYAPEQPGALRRIGVRFARPVFPGQILTLQVWDGPDGVRFQTVGPDGKPVLTHGIAEFA